MFTFRDRLEAYPPVFRMAVDGRYFRVFSGSQELHYRLRELLTCPSFRLPERKFFLHHVCTLHFKILQIQERWPHKFTFL
jgi:hypothetical protein